MAITALLFVKCIFSAGYKHLVLEQRSFKYGEKDMIDVVGSLFEESSCERDRGLGN